MKLIYWRDRRLYPLESITYGRITSARHFSISNGALQEPNRHLQHGYSRSVGQFWCLMLDRHQRSVVFAICHWGRDVTVAVSMINMKGGVGKTTVASQLAHAATDDGLRVLAVDLDPQSNLSHSLLGPHRYVQYINANRPTVAQVFDGYTPSGRGRGAPSQVDFESVTVKVPGYAESRTFDLIPSRLELSRTRLAAHCALGVRSSGRLLA